MLWPSKILPRQIYTEKCFPRQRSNACWKVEDENDHIYVQLPMHLNYIKDSYQKEVTTVRDTDTAYFKTVSIHLDVASSHWAGCPCPSLESHDIATLKVRLIKTSEFYEEYQMDPF